MFSSCACEQETWMHELNLFAIFDQSIDKLDMQFPTTTKSILILILLIVFYSHSYNTKGSNQFRFFYHNCATVAKLHKFCVQELIASDHAK